MCTITAYCPDGIPSQTVNRDRRFGDQSFGSWFESLGHWIMLNHQTELVATQQKNMLQL